MPEKESDPTKIWDSLEKPEKQTCHALAILANENWQMNFDQGFLQEGGVSEDNMNPLVAKGVFIQRTALDIDDDWLKKHTDDPGRFARKVVRDEHAKHEKGSEGNPFMYGFTSEDIFNLARWWIPND